MNFVLHIWRQSGVTEEGNFETHEITDIRADMSFLEMLDHLNEKLAAAGKEPVAYEYDCREGICGTCSLVINGQAHGPQRATTTCQTYMRSFANGTDIYIEPFRAKSFPIIRDLIVDRSALDQIAQAGGFISVNTGSAPDANAIPVTRQQAEDALTAAGCIGCGACVAACPNASASLFTGAKVSHLSQLPQGQVEQVGRVQDMVKAMDEQGFGGCTNHGECATVCPAEITTEVIVDMNRQFVFSLAANRD